MTQAPAYILTENTLSVFYDGSPIAVTKSNPNWDNILEAVKTGDFETVKRLADKAAVINEFGKGHIKVVNGVINYDGSPLSNSLSNRILQMQKEGFDVEPMLKFAANLLKNPSYRAVQELYDFLEAAKLPITPDGYFLAYKKVTSDFKDIHTETIDNTPGAKIPPMERNQVDDNKYNTCSTGYHFCSVAYLPHFGSRQRSTDKVVVLKINPADVVSIPADYDNAKGRCCWYEVVDIKKTDDDSDEWNKSVVDDYDQKRHEAVENYFKERSVEVSLPCSACGYTDAYYDRDLDRYRCGSTGQIVRNPPEQYVKQAYESKQDYEDVEDWGITKTWRIGGSDLLDSQEDLSDDYYADAPSVNAFEDDCEGCNDQSNLDYFKLLRNASKARDPKTGRFV